MQIAAIESMHLCMPFTTGGPPMQRPWERVKSAPWLSGRWRGHNGPGITEDDPTW